MNAERIAELREWMVCDPADRERSADVTVSTVLELLDLVDAQRDALEAADYLREAVCRDLDDSEWSAVREHAEAYREARAKTLWVIDGR